MSVDYEREVSVSFRVRQDSFSKAVITLASHMGLGNKHARECVDAGEVHGYMRASELAAMAKAMMPYCEHWDVLTGNESINPAWAAVLHAVAFTGSLYRRLQRMRQQLRDSWRN